jgi:hypothetical protein
VFTHELAFTVILSQQIFSFQRVEISFLSGYDEDVTGSIILLSVPNFIGISDHFLRQFRKIRNKIGNQVIEQENSNKCLLIRGAVQSI